MMRLGNCSCSDTFRKNVNYYSPICGQPKSVFKKQE